MNYEISKTDLARTLKYLSDAAALYDSTPGQRNVSRAWCIRQLIRKISKKL